jgi:hypothetical protein
MATVQEQVLPGADSAIDRTENITPEDFGGHPADDFHTSFGSPIESGQKTLDDADAMRSQHENRTHQFNDGTEQVVEPFIGNRIARSIHNADQKIKMQLAERKAAGKPPLEGD